MRGERYGSTSGRGLFSGGGSSGGEGTEANSCVDGVMVWLPSMSEAAASSGRRDGLVASDK